MKRYDYKVINDLRRKKGLSCEEWRLLYSNTFDRICNNLYKNTELLNKEREDISQHLEMSFVELYNNFIDGDDRFIFPPSDGAFYLYNYYKIQALFLYTRGKSNTIQVTSEEHDVLMEQWKSTYPSPEEAMEQGEEIARESNLSIYLETKLGTCVDDALGPEFAFWWMGYTVREVSVILRVFGGDGPSKSTVQRRLNKSLDEIVAKTGVTKGDILAARKYCINLEKTLDTLSI